jgi:hypothetical protein
MNKVLPYPAEGLRRALAYPLASWHPSNPPRTSSLPSKRHPFRVPLDAPQRRRRWRAALRPARIRRVAGVPPFRTGWWRRPEPSQFEYTGCPYAWLRWVRPPGGWPVPE